MDDNRHENRSSNPSREIMINYLETSNPEMVPTYLRFDNYFQKNIKRFSMKHTSFRVGENDDPTSFARFWPMSNEVEHLSNVFENKKRPANNASSPFEEDFQKYCRVSVECVDFNDLRQQIILENERRINGQSSSTSSSSSSSSASVSDSQTCSNSSSTSNSSRSSSSSADNISNLENIAFKKRYHNKKGSTGSKHCKTKVPYLARSKIHLDSNESDSFYDSEIENDANDNENVVDLVNDDWTQIANVQISTGSENESEVSEPARKRAKIYPSKQSKSQINSSSSGNGPSWRHDFLARMRIVDSDSSTETELEPEPETEAIGGSEITRRKRKLPQSDNDNTPNSRRKRRERLYGSSSEEDSSSDSNKNNSRENVEEGTELLGRTTRLVIEAEKKRKERLKQQRLEMQIWLKKYEDPLERNSILEYDNIHQKPMVRIDPNLMRQLKDHQVEGIRFMWETCFESCKLSRTTQGSGCILAHYMGLGKTFQVVALVHSLFSQKETNIKRVLVVCPVTILHSWHTEFQTKFNQCKRKIDLSIYKLVRRKAVDIIHSWWTYNGVIFVSYELLSVLFAETSKNKKSSKDLQKAYDNYLMNTDLIICDEGHFIKNIKTNRSKSLLNVKTHRRIILTGTPVQNNLAEYFWMINFVKPNYLGSFKEFANRFMNPIRNGQYEDSSKRDITIMKKRSYVLHGMLKEIVQRMNYDILRKYLPSKYDYVLFVQMSDIQRQLYNKFLDLIQFIHENGNNCNFSNTALFANQQIMRMIWTHPYCLVLRNRDKNSVNCMVEGIDRDESANNEFNQDKIIKALLGSVNVDDLDILRNGTKMKLLMSIIKETVTLKEKIIVFSSSRLDLTCIEHFLEKSRYKYSVDYIRIDGRNTMSDRQRLFARFCNPQEKKLNILLCSKKVGGIGLTLLPANRVVLMDVEWNPTYDQQSVYRIYRFGQTKQAAVYRLVPCHTMEQVIYERSITKMAVSHRVIDKHQISRHYNSSDLEKIYRRIPETVNGSVVSVPIRESVLLKVIKENGNIVYQVKDHASLFENRPDEELNDEERRLAWEEYENEASDVSQVPQTSDSTITRSSTDNTQSCIPSVSEPISSDPSAIDNSTT